ncbi:MAG TPA: Xaa-Pro peptidase family protein [Terriglobales bacterium]|nr:Xaa-Pro peptidase family protein [Terriglobales bacterium]
MPKRQELTTAGRDRIESVKRALQKSGLAGVVCTRPNNVLMLSGYRPVIGMSAALANSDGGLILIVPEDEAMLANAGWAEEIRTYRPEILQELITPRDAIKLPLGKALHDLKLHCAEVGYELEASAEPSYYAGTYSIAGSIINILHDVIPTAPLRPADAMLGRLRTIKTAYELQCIRLACEVAGEAFERGREKLAETQREIEIASQFRDGFGEPGLKREDVQSSDGFAWCMSGPHAAKASGAFASSSLRRVRARESVLVHANSYVNGYWTDITRTYVVGDVDGSLRQVYEAVFAARAAALAEIRPDARASDVDRAVRDVLESRGFQGKMPHSTGHGVGFSAMFGDAHPMLHPMSADVLEVGMTFNVEPAIYIENELGVRHCDMVAVTEHGMDLLTPFHATLNELLVNPVASLKAG